MKKRERLQLYYTLFTMTVGDPRISPKSIAEYFECSGRGRSPSTYLRHLNTMYKYGISKAPQLTLKSFTGTEIHTYFCERERSIGLQNLLLKLDRDPDVNYAISLSSGKFFITSRNESLNVESFGLKLIETSKMFTPIYTIPKGWNLPMKVAFENVMNSPFKRSKLPRTFYRGLDWDELDWRIYGIIKRNARQKFTVIARNADTMPTTVKKHFYEKILPNSVLINYFFPKGRDSYRQVFLRIESDFECSIIDALKELPCTSYIFPLEKSVILGLFHESITDVLSVIGKMEEKAILDDYLLYNPLACTI